MRLRAEHGEERSTGNATSHCSPDRRINYVTGILDFRAPTLPCSPSDKNSALRFPVSADETGATLRICLRDRASFRARRLPMKYQESMRNVPEPAACPRKLLSSDRADR